MKNKKLGFTFAVLSVAGLVIGMIVGSASKGFNDQGFFVAWAICSIPLVILLIYERIFYSWKNYDFKNF